jgi:hypothetical protein
MTKVRFIIAVADDNGAPFMVLERFHTYEQLARDYPFVIKALKDNVKDSVRCYQRTIDEKGVITTWEIKLKNEIK